MKTPAILMLALAIFSAACNNGSSTAAVTTASPPLTLDTLPGTVPPPVSGVLQSSAVFFNVASPGGTASVTLTSAVESNPDGTTNPSVVMGVAVGGASGTSCSMGAGNIPALMQAGANSTLSGTVQAGAYCVQVSDVTNQLGPVAFTIVASHP